MPTDEQLKAQGQLEADKAREGQSLVDNLARELKEEFDRQYPLAPQHLTQHTLRQAFFQELALATLLARMPPASVSSKELVSSLDTCREALICAKELAGWVFPPIASTEWKNLPTFIEQVADAEALSVRLGRELLDSAKRPRGRPATLRSHVPLALDLRLSDPKRWSWRALADHLCICGLAKHNFRCAENLRREVQYLRSSLKKLKVELPVPAK